jgi:pSer/pThr/pTyr-binding forkhead associated (FHA) protein
MGGSRYDVGAELVVGREGPGVRVDDAEMSRRHAVVRSSAGALTIEDLGSRNGTYVNGQRTSGVVTLRDGDVVTLGSTSFRVDAAAPAAPAATPAQMAQEPQQPFGALAATNVAGRPQRAAASRQLLPQLVAIFAVFSTAVLLVLYFALR